MKLHGTDNEDPVTKTTISKVTGGYNNNGGGGIPETINPDKHPQNWHQTDAE